ncbi:NADPH2:quinone reductase [Fusarium austroafricanum]|uniref:Probable quinone oxidoreductase n=1 Tax=Fusarium austroafricanum TaxID=2364996 RepID=A0A8H4KPU1_9HYPO|nr:NADPH2:quinone reductase [Fusarium austroafricanum]
MAPVPPSMKAVQINKNGGTEVLEFNDIPVPKVGEGQILVKNQIAGLNYIDTYFRSGLYKAPWFPLTLGREAAGTIVDAHSSVKGFENGARVVFMGTVGAYAEYSLVNASEAVIIPDDVSTEQAVAAYLQGLTAWTFICEAGQVKAGQWVLVHAASGGVGTLLVQLLRTVGAKIIGTASSEEKLALAKKNGAEWVISSHDDVVAKVKEITGGHGVDVIFDGVGKATFDGDLEMIARKGNLVSFGNASGVVDPVVLARLTPKNVRLMRPVVNGYVAERADLEKYTSELFDLIKSKKLELTIHKVYPLKDVAQAHQDIESRKTIGKLLIKID